MERKIQPWRPAEALGGDVACAHDEEYERNLAAWRKLIGAPERRGRPDRRFAAYWTEDRRRRFAIDSGEIEGLYRLRPRAKEHLVRAGLEHVREEDQVEPVHATRTLHM